MGYSDYVRATLEAHRIKQLLHSLLARTAQEFESEMRAVRKHEDEIIPQVKQSLEHSKKAYQAEELDVLQVLFVRRSYYDASVRLIQAKGNLA
jgi:cobalt-zinc-cadmium efflux system outer membrane protein